MVIRGRDWAANSWVKDDERANDGARAAERDGCWSSQPKNSAEAGFEKAALSAKISARTPKPVTSLRIRLATGLATMVNGRPSREFRQPFGDPRGLPQKDRMTGPFDGSQAWRGLAAPSL